MSETKTQSVGREEMPFDVVIVGAGPAGLSAAIRLKQCAGDALSVCVIEKGAEVGAHILSGAILDTSGLDALIPDWQAKGAPIHTKVSGDRMYLLGEAGALRLPHALLPGPMDNHGCWIVSMGAVCRWMAQEAEAMGVEIFPGFAASEPVYGENGALIGVVAGEFGLKEDGTPGPNHEPGVILKGKYTLIAEGARGSLAKRIIARYGLDRDADVPKFGLGMKELWEVPEESHVPGFAMHTMGWPLDWRTGGGGFVYHSGNRQLCVGFVVHLNYRNPHLFPYMEFQRFKHHPLIARMLKGGKRLAYGARVITEGGWQSIPKMYFPGGLLIGCAAGLVNVPRIKGNHNAMMSGILASECVHEAIAAGREGDDVAAFAERFARSAIARDLKPARNVKPLWSRLGLAGGLVGGLDYAFAARFGFSVLGTVGHGGADADSLKKAAKCRVPDYPKPDGVLSFARTTNVAFSGANHAPGQPCHLRLADPSIPIARNLPDFDEPAQRYCPAGVYEVVRDAKGTPRFIINGQNCVHCKTCDIKDPAGNITWVVPQGGDGPSYPNM